MCELEKTFKYAVFWWISTIHGTKKLMTVYQSILHQYHFSPLNFC